MRAGSLPFRMTCLNYGATLVWSEEIIDRRLLTCKRIFNEALGTTDYVVDHSRNVQYIDDPHSLASHQDNGAVIFRTTSLEREKVILQLGTSNADTALAAALMVQNDVAGVDINMGCPKKYICSAFIITGYNS